MKFVLSLLVTFLLFPAMAHAQSIEDQIASYDSAEYELTLKNGRTYTLENGILTEDINVSGMRLRRHHYDFDAEVIVHEFLIEPGDDELSFEISPTSNLSEERLRELVLIGCTLVSRQGITRRTRDDYEAFQAMYCR